MDTNPVFQKNHTYWIECPDFYVMGWYDAKKEIQKVAYHMFEQVMIIFKNETRFKREQWIGIEDSEIISCRRVSDEPHKEGPVYYKPNPSPVMDAFIVGDEIMYHFDPKEVPARYYPE